MGKERRARVESKKKFLKLRMSEIHGFYRMVFMGDFYILISFGVVGCNTVREIFNRSTDTC